MSSFTSKDLASERALITGTDDAGVARKTIISTLEFSQRKHLRAHEAATDTFDEAVTAFWAPITAATEAVNKTVKEVRDPAFFDVTQEAEQGVIGQVEVLNKLSLDTVILNMIEAGNTDRLIWIDDTIEVLAYEAPKVAEFKQPELGDMPESQTETTGYSPEPA